MADPGGGAAAKKDAVSTSARTVFVRGVGYGVDAKAFEEAFSDVGPVKQCFLVRDKGGARPHKGCGYVQYAVPEDAQRVVETMNGKLLAGRKLLVELANKRAPLEERKLKRKHGSREDGSSGQVQDEGQPAKKKRGAQEPRVRAPQREAQAAPPAAAATSHLADRPPAQKHRLVRSVALGGLSPAVKDQAIALARKAGKVEEVVSPIPPDITAKAHLQSDGCTGDAVMVVYATVAEAVAAVAALHGAKVRPMPTAARSSKGKAGKKGKEAAAQPEDGAEAARTAPPVCLLWARQVSGEGTQFRKWRVIVRNLPFKATEATVRAALKPAGFVWELTLPRGQDGKSKGFAFAAFTMRAHAEKAIKAVNNTEVDGRVVAVDWAVNKSQFELAARRSSAPSPGPDSDLEEEESTGEGDDAADVAGGRNEADDEADGGGEVPGASPDAGDEHAMVKGVLSSMLAAHGEEADEESSEGGAEGGGAEARSQPASTSAPSAPAASKQHLQATACTVFVRGLPLDVTQIQLQTKMEAYGRVKACRLVMDKASSKPKGTAFVEYRLPEGAKKAADACARGRQNRGPGVVVGGRPLEVDLALSQDGARQLAAARAGTALEGKDKRNMYLAKEGDIPAGSPAWLGMSEHDRLKRKRGMEDKAIKLRSPNFVVSTTRLSVRNIPFSMTESKLRALAIKAVKERASKERPEVKQVKILHESEESGKVDKDGKPRSKGLGFIEFTKHDHAVACLRQLNNNPSAFTNERRPIVEFAIDNVKVLKKLEAIKSKQQQQQQPKASSHGDGEGGDGGSGVGTPAALSESLTPRQRKRLQAKAKLQRRKERQAAAAQGVAAGGAQEGAPSLGKRTGTSNLEGGSKRQQQQPPQQQQQQPPQPQQQRRQQRQQEPSGKQGGVEQQRKRKRQELEMDRLAAGSLEAGEGGAGKRRRSRPRGAAEEDRLDKMALDYTKKRYSW